MWAAISPMVRIGCNCVRQKFVSRCSYLVNRKKILKHTILVGLEVELSATSEGRKPGYVVNPEVYQS